MAVTVKHELAISELDSVSGGTTYANLGTLAAGDVGAMCFIVLMGAAKSAQDDLKAIMGACVKWTITQVHTAFDDIDGASHHRDQ